MCPICRQQHALFSCPVYGSASQTLKAFVDSVWTTFGAGQGAIETNVVYDRCYSHSPEADAHWTFNWIGHASRIRERVYLHAKAEHLDAVWDKLLPKCQKLAGCILIKRCGSVQAMRRRDTIVVYFDGMQSRDTFIQTLRNMHQDRVKPGVPSRGLKPPTPDRPLPHVLHSDMFSPEVPAMTGQISGLTGVSIGRDPVGGGESFGERMSRVAAEAFNAEHATRESFIGEAVRRFQEDGVDLKRPWAS